MDNKQNNSTARCLCHMYKKKTNSGSAALVVVVVVGCASCCCWQREDQCRIGEELA